MKRGILRRWHRAIGTLLILPMIGWALTGLVFFIKPGYGGAYATLQPKLYPLNEPIHLPVHSDWLEYRVSRTVLGDHLLVRTRERSLHLDAVSRAPKPSPGENDLRLLVADAISVDPDRYGSIERVEGRRVITSTGVQITLSWEHLALSQYGRDTRWVDRLYNVHYLRWTGVTILDRALGVGGLVLLCLMAFTGFRLLIRRE